MALPTPPYSGNCLCGAVQVSVSARPLLTLACHCRDCQKLSASAYTLTTMFPKDSFSLTGEVLNGGRDSRGRRHYFCKSCLDFIYSEIDGAPQRINLRTSILDDAALFEPFVELMTDEKMPWAYVPATHSFSRFPATPEELQKLFDGYAEL